MSLTDLSLLHPDEFQPGTAHSANVKAEFQQLITRSNAVKDLVETAGSDINAAEANITSLQGRMTTAEADIDAAQADIVALESGAQALAVYKISVNREINASNLGNNSVFLVVGPVTITLGTTSGLGNRRVFLIADTSVFKLDATSGAVNADAKVSIRRGEVVMLVATASGWIVTLPYPASAVGNTEPIAAAGGSSGNVYWTTGRTVMVTLTGSGNYNLWLPEITDDHVGDEFSIYTDIAAGCTLRLYPDLTSPAVTQKIGNPLTGALVDYIELTGADSVILRASPLLGKSGTSYYKWSVLSL